MKKRDLRKRVVAILAAFAVAFTMIPLTAGDLDVNAAAYHRIYGQNRYDTAISVANRYKSTSGSNFKNVIVAYGRNFPDALSGGYLAKVKNAPILLVEPSEENRIADYIGKNLASGGRVYILGGTGVVSSDFEGKVKAKGITTERLGGQTRYETNLAILKAAGVKDQDILVCTGTGYADSLSASAVGKPILLVGSSLTAEQRSYLKGLGTQQFYLIGGTGVVRTSIEKELTSINRAKIERLWGKTRYETSVAVAKKFFSKTKTVLLAYAQNFPDGLSGGPLAMLEKAPIILTDSNKTAAAKTYVKSAGATESITLGGPKLISDKAVKTIMGNADTPETPKPPASEPTKYTITWQNWNGTVLQTTSVEKGTTPKYTGSTPQKAADANNTYSFTGWSPAVAAASANATYTAQFKATAKPAPTPTVKNVQITDYLGTVRTVSTDSADYKNPLYNRDVDGEFIVKNHKYIQKNGVTFKPDYCSNGYGIRIYNGDATKITFDLSREEHEYTKWSFDFDNPTAETSYYVQGDNRRRLAEVERYLANSNTAYVGLTDFFFDIGDVTFTAKYNGTIIDTYTISVNHDGTATSDGFDPDLRKYYNIAKAAVAIFKNGGSLDETYSQEWYRDLENTYGTYYADMKAIEEYVYKTYNYSEITCIEGFCILRAYSIIEYGKYGSSTNPHPENYGHVAFRPDEYCEQGSFNNPPYAGKGSYFETAGRE